MLRASPRDNESDSVQRLFDYESTNFENEMDEDDLEEIEAGKPAEWMVLQQVNKSIRKTVRDGGIRA